MPPSVFFSSLSPPPVFPRCVLGPAAVIGPNCVVADGVRIEYATLLEGVEVASHALIKQSVIGWKSVRQYKLMNLYLYLYLHLYTDRYLYICVRVYRVNPRSPRPP